MCTASDATKAGHKMSASDSRLITCQANSESEVNLGGLRSWTSAARVCSAGTSQPLQFARYRFVGQLCMAQCRLSTRELSTVNSTIQTRLAPGQAGTRHSSHTDV